MANGKAEKRVLDVIWLILLLSVPVTIIVTSMVEGQFRLYLVPLVIGCVVIPLMIWQILRDLFSKKERDLIGVDALAEGAVALQRSLDEARKKEGTTDEKRAPGVRQPLVLRLVEQPEVGACIELVFIILLVWLFGFLIGAPVGIFSYAKLRGEKWNTAIGVALGTLGLLLVMYFGFRLQLYNGLLFS